MIVILWWSRHYYTQQHNITYLTASPSFVINHASSSSILTKHHNVVGVAHRCPHSSTPEQKPITIIGDINIIKGTQLSHIAITKVEWWYDVWSYLMIISTILWTSDQIDQQQVKHKYIHEIHLPFRFKKEFFQTRPSKTFALVFTGTSADI
jgi:hypothetical protein